MKTRSFGKLAEHPKMRVTLYFEQSRFIRSSLSFSDYFEYRIEGEADEKTTGRLLDFLQGYANRKPAKVDLELNLTPFREKALHCLQDVPFGDVVSYGELADKIGHPKAARAIGTACHFNPYPLFIPCHRVIAAGGRLGGFAQELPLKKHLLDFEAEKPNY